MKPKLVRWVLFLALVAFGVSCTPATVPQDEGLIWDDTSWDQTNWQ